MPIQFTIDAARRLVAATVTPPSPGPDEFTAFLDAVLAHPGRWPGTGIVYDRRQVDAPDTAYMDAVAAAIRGNAARLGPCKWAVVVPDFDTFGLVGYGVAYHAGSGVAGRAFTDPGEAEAWVLSGEGDR